MIPLSKNLKLRMYFRMNNNFEVAKNVLNEQGSIIGTTSGNSMLPLFRDGKDKAVIVPPPQKLKVNDVLLYRKSDTNEIILHRIVKIKDNRPLLRGDNMFYTETDVSAEDIIGIMKGFYRSGRYYDCRKSLGYKLYIIYLRTSYPLRRLWHKVKSFLKIVNKKIHLLEK